MVPAPVVVGGVVGGVVVIVLSAAGVVIVLSIVGAVVGGGVVVGGVVVIVLSAAGVIVMVLSVVGASDGVVTEPAALSVVTLPVTAPDAGVLLIESTGAVTVAPPVAAPSLAGAVCDCMLVVSLDIDSELAPVPPASFSTRTPDETAPVFCAWLVEAAPTVAAMAAATAQLLLLIVIMLSLAIVSPVVPHKRVRPGCRRLTVDTVDPDQRGSLWRCPP